MAAGCPPMVTVTGATGVEYGVEMLRFSQTSCGEMGPSPVPKRDHAAARGGVRGGVYGGVLIEDGALAGAGLIGGGESGCGGGDGDLNGRRHGGIGLHGDGGGFTGRHPIGDEDIDLRGRHGDDGAGFPSKRTLVRPSTHGTPLFSEG